MEIWGGLIGLAIIAILLLVLFQPKLLVVAAAVGAIWWIMRNRD